MNVIKFENGIVKSWCDAKWFNESLVKQLENCASLPFTFRHMALMPDGHSGYGMPIGGVLATEDVVIPNAVGVDIGCGMCSYNTDWKVENLSIDQLKEIMRIVRCEIPVGMNRHKWPEDDSYMPNGYDIDELPKVKENYMAAQCSIGTLGGGNHFIEFQKSAEGNVYVMIHSGSRNLGKQICDHYNGIAKEVNTRYFSKVESGSDLAFLPMDTDEGQLYIAEMLYAVEFARKNRERMMLKVLKAMNTVLDGIVVDTSLFLDVPHNYARLENHFGRNVYVHRKGATSAQKGQLGIIPGSQGTSSYIVRGLGNRESFNSCSHGSGRTMGRNEAKKTLDYDAELRKMTGILHTVRSKDQLDESVGSYKDIKEVMANQADLVDIVTELSPMACIKG